MRLTRRRREDLRRAMVHPRFYAAQVGLPGSVDVDAALAHHAAEGRAAGARLSALFDPAHYTRAAAEAGVPVDGDPYEHWLEVGVRHRVVPTTLYDEDHYRRHHPHLPARAWGFADFVTDGCYRLDRQPTPFFQSYGARVPERARERQDPVLVTAMLHRADRFDLRATSWLEQGIATLRAKVDRLSSGPVADMVARAIALDPTIGETPLARRPGSFPPHLHWNMVTVDAAEDVRRTLAAQRADAVVFCPDDGQTAAVGERIARLRAEGVAGPVLCVLTGPGAEAPTGEPAVDLRPHLARLDPRQRLQVALDLVRGVDARHVLAVESFLGTRLLARYGRPLANEMTVGGVLDGHDVGLAEIVEIQRRRDEA